ncbi:MAG: N-formylglutamate amidohydrolase [Anaerolineae bacterium]|nr:N-formylglutamate amidohydrolase [Anaerolineae bacterium]
MSDLIARLIALEADVRYQEPPTAQEPEFAYTPGAAPLLLSAPHGAVHTRHGKPKDEDEFTAGIARLVAERSGAHVLWLRRHSPEDPNRDRACRYKELLRRLVQQHAIRFVLDIHGARATRPFDIALGTAREESCTPETQAVMVAALEQPGFAVWVNPSGYAAAGAGTITRFVSSELGDDIQAAQIEFNAHLRIPRRRPDASAGAPFSPRDPALIEKAILALVQVVAGLTSNG